jgi:hypothetical protein
MKTQFKTTAAYISGAICGNLWMAAAMAGKPIKKDLRGTWGFFDKGDTFRDALNSLLMREGGDFQNAEFTADTVIRIERKTPSVGGKYQVHSREIEIAKLCDCADLVNREAFVCDFLGDY